MCFFGAKINIRSCLIFRETRYMAYKSLLLHTHPFWSFFGGAAPLDYLWHNGRKVPYLWTYYRWCPGSFWWIDRQPACKAWGMHARTGTAEEGGRKFSSPFRPWEANASSLSSSPPPQVMLQAPPLAPQEERLHIPLLLSLHFHLVPSTRIP